MKKPQIISLIIILIVLGLLFTKKFWAPQTEPVQITETPVVEQEPTKAQETEVKTDTAIKYSKEDMLATIQVNKLFAEYSKESLSSKITFGTAKETGKGKAWFMTGKDTTESTASCPKKDTDPTGPGWKQYMKVEFEMNAYTGVMSLKKSCDWAKFN